MNDKSAKPTDQYDVIVVGSGVGGLATALAAAEAGLSVAVFEKDELLGGGTALAHGGIWVGCNHLAEAAGFPDSRQAVIDYLRFVGGGATEEDHLLAFVDTAPVALKFFERCGIELQISNDFPDHYYSQGPGSSGNGRSVEPKPIQFSRLGRWQNKIRQSEIDPPHLTVEEYIKVGGNNNLRNWDRALVADRKRKGIRARGPALIAYFVLELEKRNVPIFPGSPIERLVHENGVVTGVRLTDASTVSAKRGVVLATGGWEGNEELTRAYEGLPGWRSMFPASVNGDGLRMATELGAAVTVIRNNLGLFLGFEVPSAVNDAPSEFRLSSIYELLCPHTIVVNKEGKRFGDESYFQDMATALGKFDVWSRRFVNLPCFLIFDSQYVDNFSFCGSELGAVPPAWVSSGNTIEELAGKLGIDASGLAQEVKHFNQFAANGSDADFHRGEKHWTLAKREALTSGNAQNRTLGSLEKGPYYGLQMSPSAFASGGVRTTTQGQVENSFGKPIPGLYAIGNVAAHLEYGIGYQAGLSLASGMTFGYLCVEHMKNQIKR